MPLILPLEREVTRIEQILAGVDYERLNMEWSLEIIKRAINNHATITETIIYVRDLTYSAGLSSDILNELMKVWILFITQLYDSLIESALPLPIEKLTVYNENAILIISSQEIPQPGGNANAIGGVPYL